MPLLLKTFSTGGILYWVCVSVSESASQKSCEHHISKPINKRHLYPILVTDVFGFIDVLIRF